ncbi:hypothetical protein CENSYa_0061 [Cenarchaeum symbiosum A]|uniref:Uncharacterized protein n=1 Tax=Cenarchaeum symbiosum (strain A) TaxID=414004 RepID=A0RTP0_CENSY|nr:hypothetical protein CENSYa_0061 [Cenarchaeum symbiosum A]
MRSSFSSFLYRSQNSFPAYTSSPARPHAYRYAGLTDKDAPRGALLSYHSSAGAPTCQSCPLLSPCPVLSDRHRRGTLRETLPSYIPHRGPG